MAPVLAQDTYQNSPNNTHTQVAVVVIPLPAQGHLNQLLQLSHILSSYNIPVHYISCSTHNRQARARAQGLTCGPGARIHFHDVDPPYPPSPPPPTPPMATGYPANLLQVYRSSPLLRGPVSDALHSLSSRYRRIAVVHDSLMGSVAQDARLLPNAESYTFHTSSAFTVFLTIRGSTMPGVGPHRHDDDDGWSCPEFERFVANEFKHLGLASGRLYNTCRSLEGGFMDLLSQLPFNQGKRLYAIGPINPLRPTKGASKPRHRCLLWLDEQERGSVIYVSFGTTISMSKEQVRELAVGLERSEQRFIWVLRDADEPEGGVDGGGKRGGGCVLPEGFEDRVRGRGVVVRDWAPQLEILGHSGTGGFLSHCGWNSCVESISMGVPIAAWPMHSDQPKNSVLITEVLKVGVALKDWRFPSNELVKSSCVEKGIRRLMKGNEGDELRKRAGELGEKVRGSAARGGDSCLELDSFVAHITRYSLYGVSFSGCVCSGFFRSWLLVVSLRISWLLHRPFFPGSAFKKLKILLSLFSAF